MAQMTSDELRAITDQQMRSAVGVFGGKLSAQRLKAMQYYLCDAVGDLSPPEIEGRSRVVSPDVRNTIEAMLRGVSYLDVTIGGLGRGAGNCHSELMLGFLHNPKYKLRPIIECLQHHVLPIKSQLEWGFDIPYMLGGQRNEHPRAAMGFLKDKENRDYLAFYDAMQSEEP